MSYLLLEDGASHLLLEDASGAMLLEVASAATWNGADVVAAVVAWWNGTPAAQALTADGRLWHHTAPEDTALPYATVFLVSESVETWTTSYPWERSAVQVNLHAATDSAARGMGIALRGLIKNAPLTINTIPVAHVLPDGAGIDLGEGLGPGGQDCWVGFETFDVPWTTQ